MKLTYSRVLHLLYAALFVATPLVMFHRTSELFEFNKLLTIYLITGLVLAVWVARMIILQKKIFRGSFLLYAMLAFFVTQILATVFSIDVHTSIFGYYGRFNGGLVSIAAYIILCAAYISNMTVKSGGEIRAHIEKLLKISLLASIVVMVWGLPSKFGYDLSCLMFTGHLDVACWTEQFKPTVRIFSTLGQPNWFGTYLVIHFFLGIYFFFKAKIEKERYLYALYLLSTMIFILFTRSRSSLFALIVCIGLFAGYLWMRKKSTLKHICKTHIIPFIAIVALPLMLVGSGIPSLDTYIKVTSWPSSLMKHTSDPSKPTEPSISKNIVITDSGTIRKIVWQGAFGLGMAYPLFGTGPETFAYSYSFLRPIQHNDTSEWDFVYNKAHNEFFNYLATTGFIGLAGYVFMVGATLLYASYVLKGKLHSDDELLVCTLILAYIGIGITNFLGFSTTTSQVFTYMIPAFIVLIVHHGSFKDYPDAIEVDQELAAWLVIPIVIVIVTGSYVIGYFSADMAYAEGDALFSAQRYDESLHRLYAAYTIRSEHTYADKISQTLTQLAFAQSYGNPQIIAQCNDADGTVHSCIDLAKKYNDYSLKGSPKNVYYYRTQSRNEYYFYQITKDVAHYDAALVSLRKARELAPTDPRYPYYQALFALGKYENSKKHTDQDKKELTFSGLGTADFTIQLKPNYVDAYMAKGLILAQLGRKDEAKKTYQYVLDRLEPNNEQFKKELESVQ